MAVEPAPRGSAYINMLIGEEFDVATRVTAGSTSIRSFEQPLREAAATARILLCEAAAERWGVRSSECDTDGGFVMHEGKRLGFGEVADDAARLRPPDNPALRPIEGRKLAGEALPRLDLPAKSDGSFRFASDVRLPRMIFGSVRMAPPNGRLDRLLAGECHAATGRDRACRSRSMARRIWPDLVGGRSGADSRRAALQRHGFRRYRRDTSPDRWKAENPNGCSNVAIMPAAPKGSTPLAATYFFAPTPHRSLEAPAAVARFAAGRLEVWAGNANSGPGACRGRQSRRRC